MQNEKNQKQEPLLKDHQQLVVVATAAWKEKNGSLSLYEREGKEWKLALPPFPVVLGSSGLAWGMGLHPIQGSHTKVEGDMRSPAGLFAFGSAFGFAPCSAMNHLKIDYFQLTDETEAVDDPLSIHYNFIVNRKRVLVDWSSSEKMKNLTLYKWGLVVHHNFPRPLKGAGSAIFFHIWRNRQSGTAGCTAMSEDNLVRLLSWLDRRKNPALVQLPLNAYQELTEQWELPNCLKLKRF